VSVGIRSNSARRGKSIKGNSRWFVYCVRCRCCMPRQFFISFGHRVAVTGWGSTGKLV